MLFLYQNLAEQPRPRLRASSHLSSNILPAPPASRQPPYQCLTSARSNSKISYLTRILRLLPDADPIIYTNRVTVLLSSSRTPSSLKRPCWLFTLFRRSATPDAPLLCALHRRLNASTVHWLFNRLTREVGQHLNSLLLNRQLLNAEQQELVERLRELHALWFRPEDYAKSFLTPPPAGHNCRFQPNGCEACILARVGGDEEILLDLRTALLSRARKRTQRSEIRRREPTLLLFVEAWLSGLKVGDDVLGQTWTDAQALKAVRKRIRKDMARERKRKRCSGVLGLEPELKLQSSRVTDVRDVPDLDNATAAGGSGREMFGADVENDIINHCAALTSTLHLSSPVTVSDTTACQSESSDDASGTTRVASAALTRPAEEQARSYQDLLAVPPSLQAESPWEEDSMAKEDRLCMGGTLASVILRVCHVAKKTTRCASRTEHNGYEARWGIIDDINSVMECSEQQEWEDTYGQAVKSGRLEWNSGDSDSSDSSGASMLVHRGRKER